MRAEQNCTGGRWTGKPWEQQSRACARCRDGTVGVKRRLTPFWTVTDNPTPFAVNDQITPPDTDWLSVLMCRDVLALLDVVAAFLMLACLNILVGASSADADVD